jgi:hypothetical protein
MFLIYCITKTFPLYPSSLVASLSNPPADAAAAAATGDAAPSEAEALRAGGGGDTLVSQSELRDLPAGSLTEGGQSLGQGYLEEILRRKRQVQGGPIQFHRTSLYVGTKNNPHSVSLCIPLTKT